MMQKSIASDGAEMRYALQTLLSIHSKYILYSFILTIPCSVLYNTQDIHRSRAHCTIFKVCYMCTHRSYIHCTTYKVCIVCIRIRILCRWCNVHSMMHIAPLLKYTCTHRSRNRGRLTLLHRPQSASGAGLPWRLLVAIEYWWTVISMSYIKWSLQLLLL